jgi:hypothetical protein
MSKSVALRGLSMLGAFAMAAALRVTALAQPAQPRIVQSSDGTLYLVQGGSAWPLVPDQIGDDALAALNVGGEVDGIIPANLLNVAAPEAAPQAVPAEAAPPVQAAPPAPALPATVAPPPARGKPSAASTASATPTSTTTSPAPTQVPLRR